MRLPVPRLQFSLRTLVILVVIVAAMASWHGSRYARYRARLAARIQAQQNGLVLYTREEAGQFAFYKLQATPEPSLVEQWDVYWFGREAGMFPACEMAMRTYIFNPKPYAEKNYRAVLELHPEIELVLISEVTSPKGIAQGFFPIANVIGETDEGLRAQGLMPAINDFASLPNLRYFRHRRPSLLDDSWVAALPESCALRELGGPQNFSPAAFLSLLDKAPQLRKFELNYQASLTAEVRERLQEKYTLKDIGWPNYLVELKPLNLLIPNSCSVSNSVGFGP